MVDLEAIRHVADIPKVQAAARGGDVAIMFEGRATTYAELDARSSQVARALAATAAEPGARIGVLSKNHDRWYELFFGAALARACLTPINCRLSPPEIAYILEDSAPAVLFVGADFLSMAAALVKALVNPPLLVALYGSHPGFLDFAAWRDGGTAAPAQSPPRSDDDVLQLYTSGTTGRPKGVILRDRNYARFLEMIGKVDGFAYEARQSVMIVMPLFHVAGTNISIAGLAQGSRIVLVQDFNPVAVIDTMIDEAIHHTFLAPAMILMMLQSPNMAGARFDRLQTIAYGASPISLDVLTRAQAGFSCGFVQFYGMTESCGAGTYLSPADHALPEKLTSCGRPWPEVEVAVVDPSGRVVADGEIGEIVIKGDIVMEGYWKNPAATEEAVVEGWLHTGDAGLRDADGFFYVHDRMKDMIVSGGENVYPAEVENAIFGCPGVADVAVIGIPSERWGEEVKAMVVVVPGAAPTEAAVIAWARAHIASFKAPKSVDFVEVLPRNASGKVLRRALRAPYWAGRERSVA